MAPDAKNKTKKTKNSGNNKSKGSSKSKSKGGAKTKTATNKSNATTVAPVISTTTTPNETKPAEVTPDVSPLESIESAQASKEKEANQKFIKYGGIGFGVLCLCIICCMYYMKRRQQYPV